MSSLYSYKGAYPYPLLEDMSGYNLSDFKLAGEKPTITPDEVLDWDGSSWVVRPANSPEIEIKWASVRVKRDELLATSDVFVVRAYENGEPVPQETVDYRQALRDVSKQSSPFTIVWPTAPTKPF
jgi:hypothetical protein